MSNDVIAQELLRGFKRSRSTAGMSATSLSKEFLDTYAWDERLRRVLFHAAAELSPDIRKQLRYHIDKNDQHKRDVLHGLSNQGPAGIVEIEKMYSLGDPELLYTMENVHIKLIPETAKRELTRLLASEDLDESHRPDLTAMLGAVERRLAGGSWA